MRAWQNFVFSVLTAALVAAPPSARVARAAAVEQLTILLRGQSNAYQLKYFGVIAAVQSQVRTLLGFDGVTARVNLIDDCYQANGLNTINPGTALLTDWLSPVGGDWHNGWQVNTLEQGLLDDIASQPADVRAAPAAVVWLHNEYDSQNPALTWAEWTSAVAFDAALVRKAFGQPASRVTYMFVNAIPWGEGTDPGNQAIKLGMAQLAANTSFGARIAAQSADVNMTFNFQSQQNNSWYGTDHMDQADAEQLITRLSNALANLWAYYAKPGSPMLLAGAHLPAAGPHGTAATRVSGHPNELLVSLGFDKATTLQPFSAGASAGLGWVVRDGKTVDAANGAHMVDASHIDLQFPEPVQSDRNAVLYFSYGIGRIARPATAAVPSGFPGEGNAIYDSAGLPIWVTAAGLPLRAP